MWGFPSSMYVPREHLVPRRSAPSSWYDQEDDYDPFCYTRRRAPVYEDLRSSKATPLRGYPHAYPYRNSYTNDSDEEEDNQDEDVQFDEDEEVDRHHPHHPHSHSRQVPQLSRQHIPSQHHPHHAQTQSQVPVRGHPTKTQKTHHQSPPQKTFPTPTHSTNTAPTTQSTKKGHVQIPITHHKKNKPQVVPQKPVDLEGSAKKIQKFWRAWQVRKLQLIPKLKLLQKIEEEVDQQKEENTELIQGVVPSDCQYVGDIPRPIAALEHDFTAKLLRLDEIGVHGSDMLRRCRKEMVNKIEGILSELDKVKQRVKQEKLARAMEAMEVAEESKSEDKQTEIVQTQVTDHKDNTQSAQVTPMETEPLIDELEGDEDEEEMDTESEQDETSAGVPIISDIDKEQTTTTVTLPRQIPTLKHMCYKVCNEVMQRALAAHV